MGRPSSFSQSVADEICQWIANGKSLRKYCEQEGKHDRETVFRHIESDKDFAAKYAQARATQAEGFVDEMIEISDSAQDKDSAAAAKVKLETRRWMAEKMLPKKFGAKQIIEHEAGDSLTTFLGGIRGGKSDG